MFAVVHIGGKQYKVHEKDELHVEKLDAEAGKNIKIKEVLLVSDDEGTNLKIGSPLVEGAHVECKVLEHGKGDKITVFKMKAKKRYSVKQGHRQLYTAIKVLKISAVAKTATKKKAEPAVKAEKVEKAPAKKVAAKKATVKKD
jgi:large subunit ribosomal protein L21